MITRNEAIREFRENVDRQQKWSHFMTDYEALLHRVYDDFESRFKKEQDNNIDSETAKSIIINNFRNRTCKNCKYYELYPSVCCNGDSPICAGVVEEDFGCVLFERVKE